MTFSLDSSVEVLGIAKEREFVADVLSGQASQEQRGPGLLTNLEVDLADMYAGRTVEARLLLPKPSLADS
jgi:hypothetical protein